MTRRAIAWGAALAALGGQAAGQHVAVRDLGLIEDRAECMRRAEAAFATHERKHGAGERTVSDWMVYQWDLGGDGDVNAHIACLDTLAEGSGRVVGFLTVQAVQDVAGRERDRLGTYFELK